MSTEEVRIDAWEYLGQFEHPADGIAMRSCWHCNSAHEYLKNADYVIVCFVCGHSFWKGVQLSDDQC